MMREFYGFQFSLIYTKSQNEKAAITLFKFQMYDNSRKHDRFRSYQATFWYHLSQIVSILN